MLNDDRMNVTGEGGSEKEGEVQRVAVAEGEVAVRAEPNRAADDPSWANAGGDEEALKPSSDAADNGGDGLSASGSTTTATAVVNFTKKTKVDCVRIMASEDCNDDCFNVDQKMTLMDNGLATSKTTANNNDNNKQEVHPGRSLILFSPLESIRELEFSLRYRLPGTYVGVRRVRPSKFKEKKDGVDWNIYESDSEEEDYFLDLSKYQREDGEEDVDETPAREEEGKNEKEMQMDKETTSSTASTDEVTQLTNNYNNNNNRQGLKVVKKKKVVNGDKTNPFEGISYKIQNEDGTTRRMTKQEKKLYRYELIQKRKILKKKSKHEQKLEEQQKENIDENSDHHDDCESEDEMDREQKRKYYEEEEENELKRRRNPPVMFPPPMVREALKAMQRLNPDCVSDQMLAKVETTYPSDFSNAILDEELSKRWADEIRSALQVAEIERNQEIGIRPMAYTIQPEPWRRLRPDLDHDKSEHESDNKHKNNDDADSNKTGNEEEKTATIDVGDSEKRKTPLQDHGKDVVPSADPSVSVSDGVDNTNGNVNAKNCSSKATMLLQTRHQEQQQQQGLRTVAPQEEGSKSIPIEWSFIEMFQPTDSMINQDVTTIFEYLFHMNDNIPKNKQHRERSEGKKRRKRQLQMSCGSKFGCDYLIYDGPRRTRHAFAGLRIVHNSTHSHPSDETTNNKKNKPLLPYLDPFDVTGYVRGLNTAGKLALVATVLHNDDDQDGEHEGSDNISNSIKPNQSGHLRNKKVARIAIVDLVLEKVLSAPTHQRPYKKQTGKRKKMGEHLDKKAGSAAAAATTTSINVQRSQRRAKHS